MIATALSVFPTSKPYTRLHLALACPYSPSVHTPETTVYQLRAALAVSISQTSASVSLHCAYLLLSNSRYQIVYIPAQETKDFQSFSAPLLRLYDTHVSAPFFGPNVWIALVHPVSGGGIPASLQAVQLKITFKEGGAFDFHTNFERIKERLRDAVENTHRGSRGSRAVNLASVHLDELPAYEGSRNDPVPPAVSESRRGPQEAGTEPSGPPPGYEEAQQQSVANELEETVRRSS